MLVEESQNQERGREKDGRRMADNDQGCDEESRGGGEMRVVDEPVGDFVYLWDRERGSLESVDDELMNL